MLFRCKVLFLLLFIRPFHSLGFLKISIGLGLHCAFSEAILGWQKEQKMGWMVGTEAITNVFLSW